MKHASTESNLIRISRSDLACLALAVLIVVSAYLIGSLSDYGFGFPLDDAWIHQTYARNLATLGEWSFRPGFPSAGSTSPLWSMLLSLGYLIGLSPYAWGYFLGGLTLFVLAAVCEWAARVRLDAYRPRFPWVGLFIALEWHLVWAGLSGMETLLHSLASTVVLVALMAGSSNHLILGLLTGLALWIRPDGISLLIPIGISIAFTWRNARELPAVIASFLLGFGSLFFLYLFFNLMIGGAPFPNTFYAKQAEYASWQGLPIHIRAAQTVLQLFTGPSLMLLPGIMIWMVASIRERSWGSIGALIWFVVYSGVYVSRLPVYQHGRYLIPAMPILFLLGMLGYLRYVLRKPSTRTGRRLRTAWSTSLLLLVLVFIPLGARAYSDDVAVIESEMVATAKWVAAHLPPDALIAAHDIGALGFFDDHELIDLAGLVSPEVIPIIRDEAGLSTYLEARGVDYLIAFPEFYGELTANLEIAYRSGGVASQRFDHQSMAVYRWESP